MAKYSNYKKYANEILDDIETYKMVLNGALKTFPRHFWTKPWSLESSAVITRYLLEERLKINIDDIPKVITTRFMTSNKLGGMTNIVFNGSTFNIINNAYPNKFNPWDLRNVPRGFWEKKENVAKAIRWLIEDKLKWKDKQIIERFNTEVLCENGLATLAYRGSLIDILNIAYPSRFKTWDIGVRNGYWNEYNISKIIRYTLETKYR